MRVNIHRYLMSFLLVGALWLTGCSPQEAATAPAAPSDAVTAAASPAATTDPFANLPRLEGEATVELMVKGSPITLTVNGTDAPITAGNFVDLVQRGVYDGLVFHRVVREPEPFVVQGGDPLSKDPNIPSEQLGTGSFIDPETTQPRYIPLEIEPANADEPVYGQTFESAGITAPPKLPHTRGAVAMARSSLPDSASAQFYITLADLSFLDGNYAVFGYVENGMDVVDGIQQGDRIDSARVISGAENLITADAP